MNRVPLLTKCFRKYWVYRIKGWLIKYRVGGEIRRKQLCGKNYRETKFHESTIKKTTTREKNLINAFNFILMICQAFQLWNSLKINWTNAECHLYFCYQMFAGKHSIRWNSSFDHFYDGNISSKKTLRKLSEIFFMHQSLFRWSEHVKTLRVNIEE